MRQLLAVLIHWFPDRQFVFAGDGGYGTHALARFAHRHRRHLTLVSLFYPDANLYDPPPVVVGKRNGRPRKKGDKRPAPEAVVAATAERDGPGCLLVRRRPPRGRGGQRDGPLAQVGRGPGPGPLGVRPRPDRDPPRLVPLQHRPGADGSAQVIETYTGRWSIETTFQEMRAYLGLETTRGWKERTVLRAAPCLFGLYSVVALLYAGLPAETDRRAAVSYRGKAEVTFSDAITRGASAVVAGGGFREPWSNRGL